uniref:Uncharacterized protein n=1 Tax=Tanacetum cinerariifolium TaxID=118510 RepID=A0A699I8U6_TANCI|nr:hypothetical protein [Tanacetum cinerariifolium]
MRPFGCPVTILSTLDPLGLKKNIDVGQTREDNVSTQQYIMLPLWSCISSSYKSSDEKDRDDTADDDAGKKNVKEPAKCDRELLHRKAPRASNINTFNTVSTPVNAANAFRGVNTTSTSGIFSAAGPSFVPLGGSFPDDPLMPDLEDTAEV